jgi:hypothetical protein
MSGDPGSTEWIVAKSPGGDFRWRRDGATIHAEWEGVLTLDVDESGRVVTHPVPGADALFAEKLRATGAPAFVRALRGQPSLHGSAVARDGVALICSGESGAGKSTAAAQLCRVHGFELLADDAVGLEFSKDQWRVLPTETASWLEPKGGGRKGPVAPPRVAVAPALLRRIVILGVDEQLPAPVLRRVHGAAVYMALSAAMIRFERTSSGQQRELDALASIAESAEIYELVRGTSCGAAETAAALAALEGP